MITLGLANTYAVTINADLVTTEQAHLLKQNPRKMRCAEMCGGAP